MQLVAYERYQGAALTLAGEKIALEVVRHHRLIETYLMDAMGYTWDQVHDEADRLEHAISEEFEDRIARILGNPTHDPHGDPIPTKEGAVAATSRATLFDAAPGRRLRIQRVRDEDPALLKQLAALGLTPQTQLSVSRAPDASGAIQITRADGSQCDVRRDIADHVFVVEI